MELMEYRDVIRNVFIALLAVFLLILYLKQQDPFLFPGLEERFIWMTLIAGILVVALCVPYEKLYVRYQYSIHKSIERLKRKRIHIPYEKLHTRRRYPKYRKNKWDLHKLINKLRKEKIEKNIQIKPITRPIGEEEFAKKTLNVVFQLILISFLTFLLIRHFNSTFLEFIDVKYFLLTVIVFGVLTILFPYEEENK